MPRSPKRPCWFPGCPNLCYHGVYCNDHSDYSADHLRGNAAERGYGGKWRNARARFLRKHPLCVKCRENGKLTPATVVDHIIPHRGDPVLFWDESNWQPLCRDCHGEKTGMGM